MGTARRGQPPARRLSSLSDRFVSGLYKWRSLDLWMAGSLDRWIAGARALVIL